MERYLDRECGSIEERQIRASERGMTSELGEAWELMDQCLGMAENHLSYCLVIKLRVI